MSDKKIKTAKQMHASIKRIFATRGVEAAESQYDTKVCVRAVGAARDVFMSIPMEGSATEYGQSVLTALEPVFHDYNDPEGEYTSGKSSIGDAFYDIMGLMEI